MKSITQDKVKLSNWLTRTYLKLAHKGDISKIIKLKEITQELSEETIQKIYFILLKESNRLDKINALKKTTGVTPIFPSETIKELYLNCLYYDARKRAKGYDDPEFLAELSSLKEVIGEIPETILEELFLLIVKEIGKPLFHILKLKEILKISKINPSTTQKMYMGLIKTKEILELIQLIEAENEPFPKEHIEEIRKICLNYIPNIFGKEIKSIIKLVKFCEFPKNEMQEIYSSLILRFNLPLLEKIIEATNIEIDITQPEVLTKIQDFYYKIIKGEENSFWHKVDKEENMDRLKKAIKIIKVDFIYSPEETREIYEYFLNYSNCELLPQLKEFNNCIKKLKESNPSYQTAEEMIPELIQEKEIDCLIYNMKTGLKELTEMVPLSAETIIQKMYSSALKKLMHPQALKNILKIKEEKKIKPEVEGINLKLINYLINFIINYNPKISTVSEILYNLNRIFEIIPILSEKEIERVSTRSDILSILLELEKREQIKFKDPAEGQPIKLQIEELIALNNLVKDKEFDTLKEIFAHQKSTLS